MKRSKIKNILFMIYSLILLLSFLFIIFVFLFTELPKQKEQTFSTLKQNCINISSSMDRELEQMSMFALNTAYSTLVRDRFSGYLSDIHDQYAQQEDIQILMDILTALVSPSQAVDQINLYSSQTDSVIATGSYTGYRTCSVLDQAWYEAVRANPNHKAVVYTGEDSNLTKYSTDIYGKHYISYAMEIFDSFNNSQGFIEIKKKLSGVLAAAISYQSIYGEDVYVFDGNGMILYPLNASVSDDLYNYVMSIQDTSDHPESLDGKYLFCSASRKSNFCTVFVVERSQLFSQIWEYVLRIALGSICILAFALLMSYYAAKRITTPVMKICQQVSNFNLSSPVPEKVTTNIDELNTLSESFLDMQTKLRESVDKQLLLQHQDMQSRMLALQSQMNPHFLYNSLSAIQSMADEGMTDEIQIMCQSMANILRYISSSPSENVPLQEELKHTWDYLICMEIRYQGDLSYEIDIPASMNDILVPKLCIQLLVENAIKFSSTKRPPYRITISGLSDARHYEIAIRDNGPGFSDEMLQQLREKIEEIRNTGLLPSLAINGMGLLNVYIRCRLLHGDRILFELGNNPTGGACIKIGERYDGAEIQSYRC